MSEPEFRIAVGDTRTPLGQLLMQSGKPVDLAGKTVKFVMLDKSLTAKVAETDTGVTAHPTTDFTVDTTAKTIKAPGHKAENGNQIVVSSTTTLPTGLSASTRYFVVNAQENAFQVADTADGAPINISTAGSGVHSFHIVGSVQYAWSDADVNTAGYYRAWFVVYESTKPGTFPSDAAGIPVVIFTRGQV